jgi:hypothetical protein
VIDLVLQQFARLIEQIDADQPVRQPPDHLVTAAADRCQIAKLVEHRQRFDRRKLVALGAVVNLLEQSDARPASFAPLPSLAQLIGRRTAANVSG